MAAVTHCCRHLQQCLPHAFAPSSSQPRDAPVRPVTGHSCRQRRRCSVAAAAKGRRGTGDTLSEQLADLMTDHAAPRDDRPQQRGASGMQKRRHNARNRQPEAEEEDVEIYSIDSGWAKDAFASPEEISAGELVGSGGGTATAPGSSSRAAAPSSSGFGRAVGGASVADVVAAAADAGIDLETLELDDWALKGFDDLVGSASDDEEEDGAGGGEISWATDNYDFSDDEDEAEDAEVALPPVADLDAEDDDGWSVSAVPDDYRVEKAAQGSAAMREPDVGPAMQRLLDSMPEQMLRRLKAGEDAAQLEADSIDPRALAKAEARRKTHRRLRIISGTAGGKRLLSPQGDVTRPMMEMVRAAVFSMIQARTGGASRLPEGSRWLDLFAGTGSIGLEIAELLAHEHFGTSAAVPAAPLVTSTRAAVQALSRGCQSAVFVELDAWVTRACLQKNIDVCELRSGAAVFTTKAESFMERAAGAPTFAGGAFDFISVCPPYLLVSYPQLFRLLEASPLAKPTSIILVEYPKRLSHEIPDTLCGLHKVRDRKYGRTFLALFAPADEAEEADGAWEAYS